MKEYMLDVLSRAKFGQDRRRLVGTGASNIEILFKMWYCGGLVNTNHGQSWRGRARYRLKDKFHYASWFGAGSKLVRAEIWPII